MLRSLFFLILLFQVFDALACPSNWTRRFNVSSAQYCAPTCGVELDSCTKDSATYDCFCYDNGAQCELGMTWSNAENDCVCPEGQQPSPTGECESICEPYEVYNNLSKTCSCPSGQVYKNNSDGTRTCVPEPDCDENSPSFKGYLNGQPYCDHKDQCPEGETFGLVNGEMTCFKNDPCAYGAVVDSDGCSKPSPRPDGSSGGGGSEGIKIEPTEGGGTKETEQSSSSTIEADGTITTQTTTTITIKDDQGNILEQSSSTESSTQTPADGSDQLDELLNLTYEGNKQRKNVLENLQSINNALTGQPSETVVDNVYSVSQIHTAFFDSINSSPLFSAASNFSNTFNRAQTTCPVYGFTIDHLNMGYFQFDYHCDLYPLIAPVISTLMIVLWSFIAIRIFLEA